MRRRKSLASTPRRLIKSITINRRTYHLCLCNRLIQAHITYNLKQRKWSRPKGVHLRQRRYNRDLLPWFASWLVHRDPEETRRIAIVGYFTLLYYTEQKLSFVEPNKLNHPLYYIITHYTAFDFGCSSFFEYLTQCFGLWWWCWWWWQRLRLQRQPQREQT